MNITDTHCHLYFNHFADDLPDVLQRAWEIGVQKIVVPGIDVETSGKAINLAETDDRIKAAVGVHPNSIDTWQEDTTEILSELAAHPEVVAVGEIGLDYYRNPQTSHLQQEVLLSQLEIAKQVHKPVILHNREASTDLFPIMLDWQQALANEKVDLSNHPGVFHSFSGTHTGLEKLIEANFFFGISGPVTYTNAADLAGTVAWLPLSNILIETDSPFLTPIPHRGKRNEPAFVALIAKKIAEIRNQIYEEVAVATSTNAARLFSWSEIH